MLMLGEDLLSHHNQPTAVLHPRNRTAPLSQRTSRPLGKLVLLDRKKYHQEKSSGPLQGWEFPKRTNPSHHNKKLPNATGDGARVSPGDSEKTSPVKTSRACAAELALQPAVTCNAQTSVAAENQGKALS